MKTKQNYILTILLFLSILWNGNAQISLQLDAASPVAMKNLVGFNTGFNHRHWVVKSTSGGVTTYSDSIKQNLLDEIVKLKSPVLRFPGGVIANFYHLYPPGFDCNATTGVCETNFAKGYGLRHIETTTHNNGNGAVNNEYTFENKATNNLTDNWIVTFADLIDKYQQTTGDTIEVVYMINPLGHFKFGSQAADFTGNVANSSSTAFQRQLAETEDALKYLIEVRNLKVIGVELGTEFFFPNWNANDMNIDRYISLIPIYRTLLDNLGYTNLKLGVPIHHNEDLTDPTKWSYKLASATYNPNQMYDAWIIHEYQKMVDPCNSFLCSSCNFPDDECTLYTNGNNSLGCDPANDHPTSVNLENVFSKKKNRHANKFNGGLAADYLARLSQLRNLSGKTEGTLWYTEWNQLSDNGCTSYKGINIFFVNSFLHSINVFEILHSMYEQNRTAADFMEIANFHSFAAPNAKNPIISAGNNLIKTNGNFYPFQFTSTINKKDLKKVGINYNNIPSNQDVVLHAYIDDANPNNKSVYLYYTNKTAQVQPVDIATALGADTILDANIKYVTAEGFHSVANNDYFYNPSNVTFANIDFSNAETEVIFEAPYNLPAMSYGLVRIEYQSVTNSIDDQLIDRFKFELFPNPAKNIISIKLPKVLQDSFNISVLDSQGSVILTKQVENANNLDISKLAAGIYYISLTSNSTKEVLAVRKFIIQK